MGPSAVSMAEIKGSILDAKDVKTQSMGKGIGQQMFASLEPLSLLLRYVIIMIIIMFDVALRIDCGWRDVKTGREGERSEKREHHCALM